MSRQIVQFFYSGLILAGDRSTSLTVVTPFYLICVEKYLIVKKLEKKTTRNFNTTIPADKTPKQACINYLRKLQAPSVCDKLKPRFVETRIGAGIF
jgi:hypothetical protein